MAEFGCADCRYEDHYVEFKVNPDEDAGGENPEFEPELECPLCGSDAVYEL